MRRRNGLVSRGTIRRRHQGGVMRMKAVRSALVSCVATTLALVTHAADNRVPVLEQAPRDRSIAFPRDTLARHVKDMDAKHLQALRLVEGGKYDVDLRRIAAAEAGVVHPATAGLWVVLDGG